MSPQLCCSIHQIVGNFDTITYAYIYRQCNYLLAVSTAPMIASATAISATSIRLTWSEPVSLNGILHDYKIRLKLVSDVTYGSPVSVGQQMNYTVNGLRPFMDYELQVN